jgi:hypothetical protein
VLVTAASMTSGDYRSAAWLARRHAITVLPAVSSLKALRRVAKPSAATKPMIGFGNPLLDGNPAARPWEAEWAKLARQKQACPQTPWQQVVGRFDRRRGVMSMATRSGRPDLDHLRAQTPLPTPELAVQGSEASPTTLCWAPMPLRPTVLSDQGKLANTGSCTSPPTARWRVRSKAITNRG